MSDLLLEKRVSELETLVWEIPNLLNVRFARFETEVASLRGAIVDNTGRLAAMERAMMMIQTDMRDLRGGVTRQLIGQDERIAEIKTDVGSLKADVGTLKADVGTLKADVGTLKADVVTLKADVGTLKSDVGTLKADVGTLKSDVGTLKADVHEIRTDIGAMKLSLGEIVRRLPAG